MIILDGIEEFDAAKINYASQLVEYYIEMKEKFCSKYPELESKLFETAKSIRRIFNVMKSPFHPDSNYDVKVLLFSLIAILLAAVLLIYILIHLWIIMFYFDSPVDQIKSFRAFAILLSTEYRWEELDWVDYLREVQESTNDTTITFSPYSL